MTERKRARTKAYQNPGFLNSRDGRALRILSEYLEPRSRFDHHKVDDELWAELCRHFTQAEIIELTAHTTLFIGFGRFNEIVGLDPA